MGDKVVKYSERKCGKQFPNLIFSYWLLFRSGIVQSFPSTAAIYDILCLPMCVLLPPIHQLVLSGFTRGVSEQGVGEKCP
jgi:hypothetical protein